MTDMPMTQRLRSYTNIHPPQDFKPLSKNHSTSDIFVCRAGDDWQTQFCLFNIMSYIYPEKKATDESTIVLYDCNGNELVRKSYLLQPLEMKKVMISDMADNIGELGTFAVFHKSNLIDCVKQQHSYICERGYVGYKRKGDDLYSFCHGNMKSVSKSVNGKKVRSVVGRGVSPVRYKPQMVVSDCDRLELVYTNPAPTVETLRVNFIGHGQQQLDTQSLTIPKFGVRVLEIDNSQRKIHTLENWGRIILWRPVVFKHYTTHFDCLHG